MGTGAHAVEQAVQRGVLPYLPLHEGVHYERDETAKGDDHIQLRIRGEPAAVGGEPAEHRQEVKADYGKCRTYVGEAQLYEQVVQVGLVRTERRPAADYAGTHHTERVEHGDAEHGKREGHKAGTVRERALPGRKGQEHDDKCGEDYAQRERAGVADEHLSLPAEHVVQEEGHEGGGHHGGEGGHADIAPNMEHYAEDQAAGDAVARGVAVNAVDEVDGVDDAHAGEHRERDGNGRGDELKTPQPVEVVELVAGVINKVQRQDYLRGETHHGRKGNHIVHEAHYHHDDYGGKHGEHEREVAGHAEGHQAGEHAEHHAQPPEDGDRNALELAGVGVVHYVLLHGDTEKMGMDP